MKRLCDQCEGVVHPVWACPADCDGGYVEMTAAELDGQRARFRYVRGTLYLLNGTVLVLESDEGYTVIIGHNLSKLEILNG